MSEPHQHQHQGAEQGLGISADASVRTARPTDAPAVGVVQATVWREAFAQSLPAEVLDQFEPQRFASVWRQSLTEPPSSEHRLMVACAGPQVVGFAATGPVPEDEAPDPDEATSELLVLGVHPDARRTGHGSRLLNACADVLRAYNRTDIITWAPATDEATRAFLTSAGFLPDGAWRDRVVGPDGQTLREVRMAAALGS